MIWLALSSILFGFVHPGSKLILQDHLNLFGFCFLYIFFRWLVQLVAIAYLRPNLGLTQSVLAKLFLLGCIGAALQIAEFEGIVEGLQVSTVTFLLYCQPIWIAFLGWKFFGCTISRKHIIKIIIGVSGIILIIGSNASFDFSLHYLSLLAPISASLLIALWVLISNEIKRNGVTPLGLSIFYDTFALIGISLTWSILGSPNSVYSTIAWLKLPTHLPIMAGYSIFIGFLPNFLFFRSVDKVGELTAGLLLLLEPVTSAIVSGLIWHYQFSSIFFFGGILVIYAASPLERIFVEFKAVKLRLKARSIRNRIFPIASFTHNLRTLILNGGTQQLLKNIRNVK